MNTKTLVIGVENSKFAGNCSGAKYDSNRMYNILKDYSSEITLLQDSNATKNNVISELNKLLDSELMILYYSGHGGSSKLKNAPEELDGKDEYLCLYDTYLIDDIIWDFINKAKGRVFLIFDCCHSETMFRDPGIELDNVFLSVRSGDTPDMICWSGCADNTFSYGGPNGGELTNSIVRNYQKVFNYKDLWNIIKNDKQLLKYEIPKCTILGKDFSDNDLFR